MGQFKKECGIADCFSQRQRDARSPAPRCHHFFCKGARSAIVRNCAAWNQDIVKTQLRKISSILLLWDKV